MATSKMISRAIILARMVRDTLALCNAGSVTVQTPALKWSLRCSSISPGIYSETDNRPSAVRVFDAMHGCHATHPATT